MRLVTGEEMDKYEVPREARPWSRTKEKWLDDYGSLEWEEMAHWCISRDFKFSDDMLKEKPVVHAFWYGTLTWCGMSDGQYSASDSVEAVTCLECLYDLLSVTPSACVKDRIKELGGELPVVDQKEDDMIDKAVRGSEVIDKEQEPENCGNCEHFIEDPNNPRENDPSGICGISKQNRFYADWCTEYKVEQEPSKGMRDFMFEPEAPEPLEHMNTGEWRNEKFARKINELVDALNALRKEPTK
jgi:hypothetical protein